MRDWARKIKGKLAIGDPPRFVNTILLGIWFVLVPTVTQLGQFVVLVYQPRNYETGRKWEFHGFNRIRIAGFISISNFTGRLVAGLVAPLVDRYKVLHHVYMASIVTGFVGFLGMACLAYFPLDGLQQQKLVLYFALPVIMNCFQPFVVAFTARQFRDNVGTKARMLFTVYYTVQHAFIGMCTAAFFPEAPKYPDIVLTCILFCSLICAVISFCLLIAVGLFVYKTKWLVIGDYQTAETRTSLVCLAKVLCYFKKGNRFERLLKVHSQKMVHDTKKVVKVLLILLAMSYQSSTEEFWQVAWVRQFTLSTASTTFFSKVEFVTITNLLTAILIPVVQYVVVPQLRKIKLPMPVYSLLLCAGYIFLSIAFLTNIVIRTLVGKPLERYNLKLNEAQYYVFNAMDTHTYILERGLSRHVIGPGSIKRISLKVGKKLRVMNFWYDVYYTKHIKSYQDDMIICSRQGVYQEYLGDFGWIDGYSASHFGIPKLTFLCQKDPKTGGPTDYCNANTEFVVMKGDSSVKTLHMLNYSEPYNTTLELDHGYKYSVRAVFNGKAVNVDNQDISFTPSQGAWYVFVVWSGDVHLKIKYNIVTIKDKFKVNTLTALPQILSSAIGLSCLKVIISCMIYLNTPEHITATIWTWHSLLDRLVVPVFTLFLFFGASAFWFQGVVLLLALFFFVGLLAALRISRYW